MQRCALQALPVACRILHPRSTKPCETLCKRTRAHTTATGNGACHEQRLLVCQSTVGGFLPLTATASHDSQLRVLGQRPLRAQPRQLDCKLRSSGAQTPEASVEHPLTERCSPLLDYHVGPWPGQSSPQPRRVAVLDDLSQWRGRGAVLQYASATWEQLRRLQRARQSIKAQAAFAWRSSGRIAVSGAAIIASDCRAQWEYGVHQ